MCDAPQLRKPFSNLSVQGPRGEPDPGITLRLEHVAGKINVLHIEQRKNKQRRPTMHKLRIAMHNRLEIGSCVHAHTFDRHTRTCGQRAHHWHSRSICALRRSTRCTAHL
jgi:hypothetical protein